MWDTRKIKRVRIVDRGTLAAAELGSLGLGRRTAVGLLDTGEEVDLFSYDGDEMKFDLREFSGLTVSLARRLRHERELAYLQS